ncbi:MAG: DUF4269 domain-containing protein [Clostridiales bacterium]|nr:DUF4269 domain-containing protein [Clostridiales bacterium]
MIEQFLNLNNELHKEIYHLIDEIMKPFDKYQPTIVGTYPIDIQVQGSDIDIILMVKNYEDYIKELSLFSHETNFTVELQDVVICRFEKNGYKIELYASHEPINTLNSYRHLEVEKRVLDLFGKSFKEEVLTLKRKGLKTEPAFCVLLGLYGNAYKALFEIEDMTDQELLDLGWSNDLKLIESYDLMTMSYFQKGWSEDIKVIGRTAQKTYLIRQTPKRHAARKRQTFEKMRFISDEVKISKPVLFSSNHHTIELYEWLEGDDLETQIEKLTAKEQYDLGIEAGQIQKHIHRHEGNNFDWYDKYSKKIYRIIDAYQNCGIKMPEDDIIIDYLIDNMGVLKDRPIVFQHGDYHLGNMLYTPDGHVGIIDFNRSSEGDPWEEYDRFIFTYRISPYFALGQLHGYFDTVPGHFFEVVAVYAALNCLAGIPWAIPFGEEDIQVMKDNYLEIYKTYDGFKTTIPSWYLKCVEEVETWNLKV